MASPWWPKAPVPDQGRVDRAVYVEGASSQSVGVAPSAHAQRLAGNVRVHRLDARPNGVAKHSPDHLLDEGEAVSNGVVGARVVLFVGDRRLDFPNVVKPLFVMLDRLDEVVLSAGGRVYLGKDARLDRETFRRMYPEWEDWKRVRDAWDPDGNFQSDLGRRLGLC